MRVKLRGVHTEGRQALRSSKFDAPTLVAKEMLIEHWPKRGGKA